MILYALIFRPTYPNFLGHVTGNTHTFLFGLSQSATLKEWSVQGCKGAKHKTYSPLDDHWVILSTSKAFHYFWARGHT